MNVTTGPHRLLGTCPRCGEAVDLRISLQLDRGRTRNRWQTRARIVNLGQPHECRAEDTYPMFPVAER